MRAHAKPAIQFSFWTRMKARLRSMAMLAMVLLTFPISLALVALSIAREWAALIADGKAAEVSRRLRAGLPGAERHVLGTALVSGGLPALMCMPPVLASDRCCQVNNDVCAVELLLPWYWTPTRCNAHSARAESGDI